MVWVLVILGVLALAVFSPGFRALALAGLGLLLILGIVFFAYLRYEQTQADTERAEARRRVAPQEIDLVDLTLKPMYAGSSSFTLAGRVRNRSRQYTLTRIELRLTMKDCVDAVCEVVGETIESISLSVPRGQARDMDDYVSFTALGAPRGRHTWEYALVSLEGR